MKGSKVVAVVEAMDGLITVAGVAETAGAVAVVVAAVRLEKGAARAVLTQTIIPQQNGTSCPLKSVTRFARSVIRKASKGVPSDPSVIFQLSNSLQLSARLKVIKLRLLLPILLTRILPAVMLEMPLAEKREQSEPSPLD
jgi:hypothetical protein